MLVLWCVGSSGVFWNHFGRYFPDGKFIQNLSGHNAVINSVAINPDGVLASGADNGTLNLWDYRTGHRFQQEETIVQPGSLDSEVSGPRGLFAMQRRNCGPTAS
jgi:WD40 repeat protein